MRPCSNGANGVIAKEHKKNLERLITEKNWFWLALHTAEFGYY